MMRWMEVAFAKEIAEGWLKIYIDDFLIAAKNDQELEERTKRVLRKAAEIDIYFKPEKCAFKQTKVDFCGMIISENSIAIDPIKIQGILDWPIPTKVRDIRAFIGFVGFYRPFINGFSKIAKPLHDLTKKDRMFIWGPDQELAF